MYSECIAEFQVNSCIIIMAIRFWGKKTFCFIRLVKDRRRAGKRKREMKTRKNVVATSTHRHYEKKLEIEGTI